MNKILGVILVGIVGAGGTYALTTEQINQMQQKMNKIQQEKILILKENIWLKARLNEIPIWDIDVVSAEEMSTAYTQKANEEDATNNPNLFEGLRLKTIEKKINCK